MSKTRIPTAPKREPYKEVKAAYIDSILDKIHELCSRPCKTPAQRISLARKANKYANMYNFLNAR